jgi:hypothetical protein
MGRTMFYCPTCGEPVSATGACPRCGKGGVPEGSLRVDEPDSRSFLATMRDRVAALLGRRGAGR